MYVPSEAKHEHLTSVVSENRQWQKGDGNVKALLGFWLEDMYATTTHMQKSKGGLRKNPTLGEIGSYSPISLCST